MKNSHFFLLVITSFFAVNGLAQSSLEAHVHGEAELLIAIESDTISMQFVSPAANIYGFEHKPKNEEQRRRIIESKAAFSRPNDLFEFTGANCETVHSFVNAPFADEATSDRSHHEEHDHSDHGDHGDHGDHKEDTHVEVTAEYEFKCDSTEISAIKALFLNQFPAIESLDAQWVMQGSQGAKELSGSDIDINLR